MGPKLQLVEFAFSERFSVALSSPTESAESINIGPFCSEVLYRYLIFLRKDEEFTVSGI